MINLKKPKLLKLDYSKLEHEEKIFKKQYEVDSNLIDNNNKHADTQHEEDLNSVNFASKKIQTAKENFSLTREIPNLNSSSIKLNEKFIELKMHGLGFNKKKIFDNKNENLINYSSKEKIKISSNIRDIYYDGKTSINEKNELQNKIIHFHQDPYHFLDILVEKYFQQYLEKIPELHKSPNNFDDKKLTDLKQFIREEILRGTNSNFKTIEIDKKDKENNNYLSKPLNEDEQQAILKGLSSSICNFEGKNDIYKRCLENPESKFSTVKHKLTMQVLHCLKGESIVPPENKFYSVYDKQTTPEIEATKNLLDIQKEFNGINNNYNNIIRQNIENSIKIEEKLYSEFKHNTNELLNEIGNKISHSENLMGNLFVQLDEQFEKNLIKRGLDELKLVNNKLEKVKSDIILKHQYIENQKERIEFGLEQSDKLNRKIDIFLKEYDIEKNDETSLISDSQIELLYDQYKDKSILSMNENTTKVQNKSFKGKVNKKSSSLKKMIPSYDQNNHNTKHIKNEKSVVNHKYLKATNMEFKKVKYSKSKAGSKFKESSCRQPNDFIF